MVFSCPGAAFRAVPGSHSRSCRSNSSSSRKKQPKSSFSIGFRSYVREFLGAIFMLFRPSVPWCFPVREPLFEPCRAATVEAAGATAAVVGKSSQNRHFLSVSEVTLGTFWAQFSCFSVLPCHGVFLSGSRFSSRAGQPQ